MPSNESMLDIYLFENSQLLQKLESVLLISEREGSFSKENVAEIFRILHTIKGSSAMMNFDNIAELSHALEDLFAYLRDNETRKDDHGRISELAFETMDTINAEIAKLQNNGLPDGDLSELVGRIGEFLDMLKSRKAPAANQAGCGEPQSGSAHYYKAKIVFERESKMENIRAFGIVKSLEKLCSSITTIPEDLFGEHSDDEVAANGVTLFIVSGEPKETILSKIREAFFIQNIEFEELDSKQGFSGIEQKDQTDREEHSGKHGDAAGMIKQNYMSVNINKLNQLMDLVGELVITEATVTKNPEICRLKVESFEKAARQLRKLTGELQDIVMSIRMVPVSTTFHKMERVLRDMSAKIDKKAKLVILGEDTEVDKSILDKLSDPIMHLVRNSMDHGIESPQERVKLGKNPTGVITLEARSSGGDVLVTVSDDGRGLNKDEIIDKGIEKGLITKPRGEVTDREAYSLIFSPGFSTKTQVTEFSGRGVGMDAVLKNIEAIGGSVSVDSEPGRGMSVQIKIPLTLAIIDGMQVCVGNTMYIIPILSMRESFTPKKGDVFRDPGGNEMIHLRGKCYPVIRLNDVFGTESKVTAPEDGTLILIEAQNATYCLLVDALVGEHKTVVKPMPVYISKILGEIKSIAGCTILGDGTISLILDANGLYNKKRYAV